MKNDPILSKAKFRLLLIASLLCIGLGTILDAYDQRSIAVIMLAGLFFFKPWARTLYLYSYFPLLLLYLLPGFSWTFISGLGAIFYEMGNIFATLIWGTLLLPSLYQSLFCTPKQ